MTPSTTRPVPSSPFGSRTRTAVLLLLVERGQAHLRELARHLGSPLSVVQHALRTLERDGLVACQMSGRVRLARLDPRYPAHGELVALLTRLATSTPGNGRQREQGSG